LNSAIVRSNAVFAALRLPGLREAARALVGRGATLLAA